MRSKAIYNIAAVLAGVMLAGCAQDKEIPVGGLLSDEAVRFTAAIETAPNSRAAGPETRTTTGGDEWATGDRVGVFMLAAGGEITTAADVLTGNAPYTVTAPATGALAPDGNDMYYPMEGSVDFTAYYPYNAAVTNGSLAVDVTDQSDRAALDVLYAKTTGVAKSTEAVNLAFEHVLSKITFNITLGDGLEALTESDIAVVAFSGMPASATLDLSDGTLTAATTPVDFEAMKAAAATAPAVASFSALVIPQEAGMAGRTAAFTVDGETYTWEIPDAVAFAAGDHYVYPVTVQKTGITVGAPTIADWTQNENGTTTPQIIIAEGKTGPLSWVLFGDGTLTISGEGAMPEYNTSSLVPWNDYDAAIETVVIESGVTTIGDGAFGGCSNLDDVTIPGSVTSIMTYAFQQSGLKSITIPGTVKNIGRATFHNCPNLASVTMMDGVESIGNSAFSGCPSLASVTIPGSVKSMDGWAFANCENLESVTMMDGVASIGNSAFKDCLGLKSVTIPGSVKSIGQTAFDNCMFLTSLTMMEGVESIERYAFGGCTSLVSVTIPGSVKSIGEGAFSTCRSLVNVTVLAIEPPILGGSNFTEYYDTLYVPAASLTAYQNSAWAGVFTTITAVDGIISEGVAGPLTWVLTSDGTLTISGEGRMPDYGINNNTTPWTSHAVKKVVVTDGVESIGDYAFFRCPNLAEINIPASVTDISTGETTAFLQCYALSTLTVAADNPNYALGPRGELMSKDLKTLYLVPKNITGGYELVADNVAVFAFQGCTTLSLTVAESHPTYAHGPRGELMGKDWNGNKLQWVPESIKGDYLVPDGTVIITYGATYGLGVTHLFIPASVARIEEYTFCSVDNLTDITLMGEWPPQLSGGVNLCFWGTDKGTITLHVPAGKKAAYESAGYVGFREIREDAVLNHITPIIYGATM